MPAAARPYVMAAAALAAASVVVVTPTVAQSFELPVRSIDTRLVDADSILNVPINLFEDFLNIPYNEINALDQLAASDFVTGTWWTPSSSNIWGIDPGDEARNIAITDLIAPFTAADQGTGGLQYEIGGFLAAELPASGSCDAETCAPITPTDQYTGITDIDRLINYFGALTGHPQFGLFDNWFKVPLSELIKGYNFDNNPGIIDPSGPVNSGFGDVNCVVNTLDCNPFAGGTVGDNEMPWSQVTDFKFNLLQPLDNFLGSLTQSPTGIDIPTFHDIIFALQSNLAGAIVDFYPFVPGSTACIATCDIPSFLTQQALVGDIAKLAPNNPMISEWLAGFGTTDNGPTTTQVDASLALLQTGFFNLTETQLSHVDSMLAAINPELPALLTNAGILTDPGYLAFAESGATGTWDPVYGGYDPDLVFADLIKLFDPSYVASAAASHGAGLAADASTLSAGLDSAPLVADLTDLLGNFGANLGPDLANMFTSLF
jgi:hypothetical protein